MKMSKDLFVKTAEGLIKDLKRSDVSERCIEKLTQLLLTGSRKEFIKYFKRVSGATNFDLPDIIYTYA